LAVAVLDHSCYNTALRTEGQERDGGCILVAQVCWEVANSQTKSREGRENNRTFYFLLFAVVNRDRFVWEAVPHFLLPRNGFRFVGQLYAAL